jgi:hypothetical protein
MNMTANNRIAVVIVVIALALQASNGARADINEERQGEANPSAVIFHATLFGAGTGLLLGGAYALVENSSNRDTWDTLRWSVAGGTVLGFVVGLVYVTTRSGPNDAPKASELSEPERSGRLRGGAIRLRPRIAGWGGPGMTGSQEPGGMTDREDHALRDRRIMPRHRPSPEFAVGLVSARF